MGYQPLPVETYRWHDGTPHCGKCHDLITSHDVSCPHCGKRFTSRAPLKFGGYSSRDMLSEKIEQEPTAWEQASKLVIDIHRMRSEAEQNITFVEQELAATRTRIKDLQKESDHPLLNRPMNRKLDIDTYR